MSTSDNNPEKYRLKIRLLDGLISKMIEGCTELHQTSKVINNYSKTNPQHRKYRRNESQHSCHPAAETKKYRPSLKLTRISSHQVVSHNNELEPNQIMVGNHKSIIHD